MKNFFKQSKNHLRDNRGDGYIWFLSIAVVLLLLFGSLFTVMSTAVNMRDIRTDVDAAAMDVFADMRTEQYDKLTDGSTSFTDLSQLSNVTVLKKMNSHLGATYVNDITPYLTKVDARGHTQYTIENFDFSYVPHVNKKVDGFVRGDLNHDGECNNVDVSIVEEFVYGSSLSLPSGVYPSMLDFNGDGMPNEKDLAVIKSLVKYYAAHPIASSEGAQDKDSALLVITFDVRVPIRFGTSGFGEKVEECSYYSTFSFIPGI